MQRLDDLVYRAGEVGQVQLSRLCWQPHARSANWSPPSMDVCGPRFVARSVREGLSIFDRTFLPTIEGHLRTSRL